MLIFLLGLGLFSEAISGDAIDVSAIRVAQVGGTPPQVNFRFSAVGQLSASLDCGGKSFALRVDMVPGESGAISLIGLKEGTHRCHGVTRIDQPDGAWGEMPLNFDVLIVPPLDVSVDREGLSLNTRQVQLVANHPMKQARISVFSLEGEQLLLYLI